jgi:uroporphyrinogen-III synthase
MEHLQEDQRLFQALSLQIKHLPCIKTVGIDCLQLPKQLQEEASQDPMDCIISSVATLKYLQQHPKLWNQIKDRTTLYCFGEKVAATLQASQVNFVHLSEANSMEQMANQLHKYLDVLKPIILPGGKSRAFDMSRWLTKRGYSSYTIDLYETISGVWNKDGTPIDETQGEELIKKLHGTVCFASPSAVHGFCNALHPESNRLGKELKVAAIGETTARACESKFANVAIAEKPTLAALVGLALTL